MINPQEAIHKDYKEKVRKMFERVSEHLLYEGDEELDIEEEQAYEKRHLVLVFDDVNDPGLLEWSLRVSKRTIEEHRELENSGVLVVTFLGEEMVDTRIMSIEEALRLIP